MVGKSVHSMKNGLTEGKNGCIDGNWRLVIIIERDDGGLD